MHAYVFLSYSHYFIAITKSAVATATTIIYNNASKEEEEGGDILTLSRQLINCSHNYGRRNGATFVLPLF